MTIIHKEFTIPRFVLIPISTMSSNKSSKNHRENPRQRITRKKRAKLATLRSLTSELEAVRAAATKLGGKSFISSLLGRVKQLSSADTVNIIARAFTCNQLIADISALHTYK
jgi:hypothetical protein